MWQMGYGIEQWQEMMRLGEGRKCQCLHADRAFQTVKHMELVTI